MLDKVLQTCDECRKGATCGCGAGEGPRSKVQGPESKVQGLESKV